VSAGTVIFAVLVVAVTMLGFAASRWRQPHTASLEEWALGGRRFGTLVSWFLIGGDLYTAYTFIALPALAFGAGAIAFFAVPFTTIGYPISFVVMSRFWTIAKRRGYVTIADFVNERFGNRALELAVAVTGVLATMPYIALQMIGMQAVLEHIGLTASAVSAQTFLIVAFLLLAIYTFISGLRAPAMIAFVKDALIYATIIVALAIIPAKLGGWGHVFAAAQSALASRPKPSGIMLAPSQYFSFVSLALGSAIAMFAYPHAVTGTLSSKSADVIRRNCALLPLYSLVLAFLALLGYCALAAHVRVTNSNAVIPELFVRFFPEWFAGIAFAAIAIGALVPAAVMSISAANLFAGNILRSFSSRQARAAADPGPARMLAPLVLAGALAMALFIKPAFAINFQLLGGAWILQVIPAVILGLYVRFHPAALIAGWLAGMACATWMAVETNFASVYPLHIGSAVIGGAILFYAFLLNVAVTLILSWILGILRSTAGTDLTAASDFA
jgi:SSS family solute:Na+ symporter